MFVDWTGLTTPVIDRDTGEVRNDYFFVAVLGAGKMFFTEPFLSQDLSSWVQAHVHAFEYFGGTTEIIIPDTAILDRLVHNSEIFNMVGESYRLQHSNTIFN